MKHLGIIFLLLVPFLLVGQAWKAKPFSISVFNNATLLPPGSITATFNQPIHPGIMLGYEFGWQERPKSKWFQNAGLGFFYHRFLYSALVLNTQAGYRRKIKHFSVEGLLQSGYMHAFYLTDRVVFQSDGTYKAKKGIGKPQFIAGAGIGVGYDLGKVNRMRRIFLNYDFRLQIPFVKSYVPILPNGALSLGIQFNIQ